VTNEKTLLARAGLQEADQIIAGIRAEPPQLESAVETVRALCSSAVRVEAGW
ncbi:MAG: nucleotidyltransferase domain-containing protein, partial [Kutzneria sp.]|nr:nucleotidyltransferase domain-containing protein [Kutzneria sp.]